MSHSLTLVHVKLSELSPLERGKDINGNIVSWKQNKGLFLVKPKEWMPFWLSRPDVIIWIKFLIMNTLNDCYTGLSNIWSSNHLVKCLPRKIIPLNHWIESLIDDE